jgi:hypothetical protein
MSDPWVRDAGPFDYTFVGAGGRMTTRRLDEKMAERGWERVPAGSGFAGDGSTFRRLKRPR